MITVETDAREAALWAELVEIGRRQYADMLRDQVRTAEIHAELSAIADQKGGGW